MYCLDFPEEKAEKRSLSKEDEKFLHIMKTSVTKYEGHYQLPLPFRNENCVLPSNKAHAHKRLMSTRKKMLRDEGYRKDYVACMDKLLEKGYATRSDASPKGRTWYHIMGCATINRSSVLSSTVLQVIRVVV